MIPTKEDMIAALEGADDTKRNVLVLNTHGRFEVREHSDNLHNNKSVAVMFPSFSSHLGWTGPGVSDDVHFIRNTYNSMLRDWLAHLRTGETGLLADEDTLVDKDELQELVLKINELRP